MSDETDCTLATHSIDESDSLSCYIPRKKIKLTPTKNRNARSLTDKTSINQINTNSWKFIDKNETMIAELSGGKLTLWQFLLELLMTDQYSSLIKWTDRNIGEFILIQAEEVAKLWGIRKDRNHRMNYDKLSRALRYYYQKNIIKKVHGHKFVYRFVSLIPETTAGSSTYLKPISPVHENISPQNQPNILVSDAENASNDNSNQRTPINRLLASIPNTIKSANKNNKKTDFNSTLTALFQAALLSLSGPNPEISPSIFLNHKESESRVCSPESIHTIENTINRAHTFDNAKQNLTSLQQECICKADVLPSTTGMFFSSPSGSTPSIHLPPFDRQSMLHFSRHSINMQRLSQEILLHATSKSRFNPCISNTIISPTIDSISNSVENTNNNFWLNQFASDLYKSTVTGHSCENKIENLKNTSISPIQNDLSKVKIKSEKNGDSIPVSKNEDLNSLTSLFRRFVNEFENKNTTSSVQEDFSQQYNNYSHTNLANLIKSQLSSNSSFVWMPVPVNFAEEIMDFCVRSLKNHST